MAMTNTLAIMIFSISARDNMQTGTKQGQVEATWPCPPRNFFILTLKQGYGEHFVSIAHAQTWVLLSLDEARSMLFTRAAMSSARAVRLSGMMGLHRIDADLEHQMAPTLAAPKDWIEIEERRRTFWGVFGIDCYASMATGWPTLMDPDDVRLIGPAQNTEMKRGQHYAGSDASFTGRVG